MTTYIPYGKTRLAFELPDGRFAGEKRGSLDNFRPDAAPDALAERAMREPVGSPRLAELARGEKNVVVIISDHTRPVPSRVLLPPMLREIREGNPRAEITLLVATGCHRGTTADELRAKLGDEVFDREKIVVHDCDANNVDIGELPSGGRLEIDRVAAEAELLVAEGFIEPHFFAGFSGGRKSVLPGVASRASVMWNHNAGFINSPESRAGNLESNPIHKDMLWACRAARLAYVSNAVINSSHEMIAAFAGDPVAAHKAGTDFLTGLCRVSRPSPAPDVVITSNNGYPLDQNIYQSVKGMRAGSELCRDGGIVIMCSECADGHGGEGFYKFFRDEPDPVRLLDKISAVAPGGTTPDQWEAQILAMILKKNRVVFVSDCPDSLVRDFGMIPARSAAEAVALAESMLDKPVYASAPDGVSVIVG